MTAATNTHGRVRGAGQLDILGQPGTPIKDNDALLYAAHQAIASPLDMANDTRAKCACEIIIALDKCPTRRARARDLKTLIEGET